MKKILVAFLSAMVIMSMSACSDTSETPSENSTPQSSSEVVDSEKKLTDRAGNEIIAPIDSSEIGKIVSYAPSLTEILVDLGLGDRIVAITSFDTNEGVPEDVLLFDMMNADIEAITALEPDLILTTEITNAGQSDPFSEIRNAGAIVANVPTATSIEGIYEDIAFIGELLGVEDNATAMIDEMKATIDGYTAKSAEITEKKTVYFEISAAPYMYSTGTNTYLSEMIEIVGGVNVFADQEGWFAPNDEMILTLNPDFIFTNVNYIENSAEEVKTRNGWEVVTAVANGDVYYVENLHSSIPNHSIVAGIEEMGKLLYPEVYGE